MPPSLLPSGVPQSVTNLIQQNALIRVAGDSLRAEARFRADAKRVKLQQGMGTTATYAQLGLLDVDLKPAETLGAPDRGSYEVETYTGAPIAYKKTLDLDAMTAYVQSVGQRPEQLITRIGEWAGRTSNRVARGKEAATAFGSHTIIRRAQSSGDSILLVDSLAGFRTQHVGGVPLPVSATNGLPITIKAAGDITNRKVTGVTPLNANYPDGPGELTLDGTLGGTVAANSFVFVQRVPGQVQRAPMIVRASGRASTEALLATDLPTYANLLQMRQRLVDRGVRPHRITGTYHLHVDATFFEKITADTAWRQAFQGAGMSPIFGAGSFFSPALGLTVLENNDNPALGKGKEVVVGSAGNSGVGGVGAPGASVQMQDIGLAVVNSSGVAIRRAIMTGEDVMIETYIDHKDVLAAGGAKLIHSFGDLALYDLNGRQFFAGNMEGWTMIVRPPLDETAMVTSFSAVNYFDFTLPTDVFSGSNTSDFAPNKRAIGLEYGSDW